MADSKPTAEEWRKLYAIAAKVNELAPWKWMFEDSIFGMQNPETGETGFVSVMGMAGEHISIAVYPDAAALHAFLKLEEDAQFGDSEVSPERVLEIPQIQASFEDRNYLQKEDHEIIKKLGLKFRGSKSWPMFRNYTPGLFPWFISGAEARFLNCALEQLLEVAPRVREDEDILTPTDDDEEYLVRVSREENGKLVWEDKIVKVSEPAPLPAIKTQLDPKKIEQLRQKKLVNRSIELDVRMLPTPVKEKGRPFFPYIMLIADSKSGMILGMDMLQPLPSIAAMRADAPNHLLSFLLKLDVIAHPIVVSSEWLAEALTPLANESGLKLVQTDSLPGVEEALAGMMEMGLGML